MATETDPGVAVHPPQEIGGQDPDPPLDEEAHLLGIDPVIVTGGMIGVEMTGGGTTEGEAGPHLEDGALPEGTEGQWTDAHLHAETTEMTDAPLPAEVLHVAADPLHHEGLDPLPETESSGKSVLAAAVAAGGPLPAAAVGAGAAAAGAAEVGVEAAVEAAADPGRGLARRSRPPKPPTSLGCSHSAQRIAAMATLSPS